MAKAVKTAVIVAGIATGAGMIMGAGALTAGAVTSLGFAANTAAAYFTRSFVTALVLGTLSSALTKSPAGFGGGIGGTTVTGRNSIAPRQIIYGRNRVGGTIVYMEGTNSNKYLHMVIALAGHEIDAIEKVYFGDEEVVFDGNGNVTTGKYANKVRIKTALGTDDQVAFTDLVSESDGKWTSNHRLRGVAALYVRLEHDQDKFFGGVPNISALIRGKKVYDPRTTSTAWSQNPALCLNDYLTNSDYGLGCVYANEIDASALIAAANICDEDVSLVAGGTENTYELNGSFNTGSTPETIINSMLTSMIGKAVWSGGKWRIMAGAYYTPNIDFDEGDLRSGFKVQTRVSRRENFNSVKGTHPSATENYVATEFPSVIGDATTNATMANYVAEDNGEIVYKTIELPFTVSSTMAQRIAKIELERARQQITLTLPLKLVGLKAKVGDVITVTNTRMGWSSKPFEVVGMTMTYGEEMGVDVELRETASEVFDWTVGTDEKDYDPAPNTNLPNAFDISAPTDLAISATNTVTPDGSTQSGLLVTWTPPLNSFVTQYEVQYIRGASNFDWGSITNNATESVNYGSITTAAESSADYGNVADATASGEVEYNTQFVTTPYFVIATAVAGAEYAVRVRAVNSFGVRSSFVTSNETTYGDETPPNVPSEITANGGYKEITLTWVNPTVSDFDYVEVHRAQTNSVSSSTRVGVLRGSKFVDTGLGINITRYYWLKSVDRSGNKSDFSSPVSATTAFIDSDSFSQEVLNLFSEAGAYGIEPVATLPATGDFDGQIKYDTTLNKLYRWNASTSSWSDDIFSITSGSVDEASFAAGIEPVKIVSELPNPSGYTGAKVVFLTTDNKLYRYDGAAWVTGVAAADIEGTLASSNFAQDLRPVEIVSALPSADNFQGRVVVLTSDNKLYRYTGSAWTAAVNTNDLSGSITSAQIASVAAASVTGTLTDAQIADLATAKLTGTISETQITDGAISSLKIAANAVTTAKIALNAITADVVSAGAITETKISNGAISTEKIAANAVTASQINAGSITSDKIAAGAVTAAEIAADSVTSDKIAAGAVTATEISSNAVTAVKISAGAVSTAKIAAGAVTADTISSNAITAVKIQAGAVETAKIAAGAIDAGKIAADAVTADKIAANAVTAESIAADSITTAKIAAGAVTADILAANSVVAGKIAAAAVSADQIAANAITATKIATNAITADKILAGSIQTDKIAANSITGGLIAASGVITSAAQIDDAVITNAKIANGAITTAKIEDAAITAAKIQSLSLVGEANFEVKTATTGARIEMTNKGIKVFDASGTLRVHIGDLLA